MRERIWTRCIHAFINHRWWALTKLSRPARRQRRRRTMGDFLISWRDFDTEGNAGTMMGSRPTYYDMEALKKVYTLGDAILNRDLWLDALRPSGPTVVVFVHGFAD